MVLVGGRLSQRGALAYNLSSTWGKTSQGKSSHHSAVFYKRVSSCFNRSLCINIDTVWVSVRFISSSLWVLLLCVGRLRLFFFARLPARCVLPDPRSQSWSMPEIPHHWPQPSYCVCVESRWRREKPGQPELALFFSFLLYNERHTASFSSHGLEPLNWPKHNGASVCV